MVEQDGFRIEAALQFGFSQLCSTDPTYRCTEAALIAFAKACERKGLAEAKQMLRREINNPLNAAAKSPLIAALGAMTKKTEALDAETRPVREAEKARFMTAQGYVRAADDQPGARWIKPAALCDDEGCPQHGTNHVCVEPPLCAGGQPITSESCETCGASMDDDCGRVC